MDWAIFWTIFLNTHLVTLQRALRMGGMIESREASDQGPMLCSPIFGVKLAFFKNWCFANFCA
jgi:hypothetical protein